MPESLLAPRTWAIALAVLAVAVLGGGQLLLPGAAEDRIRDRLVEHGGSAEVSVRAVPAVRLLFGDGDRIRVRGSGLRFDLSRRRDSLEKLDGFDDVEIRLDSVDAGPFEVSRFELTRDGGEPYALRLRSSFSPARLAAIGASRAGGGGLLGSLLGATVGGTVGGALPPEARSIPVDMDVRLESESGRARVTGGRATVAGYPVGPLAELITAAIVVRI
jgi:hypothetical protein